MADCEFSLPCESTISNDSDALTITNNGAGGAIKAESVSNPAVIATTNDGFGILGVSNSNHGVRGISSSKSGVFGSVMGASGFSPIASGVVGDSSSAPGVVGSSDSNVGVEGRSASSVGVLGVGDSEEAAGDSEGVVGISRKDVGVKGICEDTSLGVLGVCELGTGVYGWGVPGVRGVAVSPGDGVIGEALREGVGVRGNSVSGVGVLGTSSGGEGFMSVGVRGTSSSDEGFVSVGVEGQSQMAHDNPLPLHIGVRGIGRNSDIQNIGVVGSAAATTTSNGIGGIGVAGRARGKGNLAGHFAGDVMVTGSIAKGGGGFKIDHPLDPANKYFSHSFVESPEMKNVYDGVVTLDGNGELSVELPDWFEGLNSDFRYQLTAIGEPAPDLHVAQEVAKNRFTIAGGKSGMKVSWQVTGIRKDPWAQAHPLAVEEEKPSNERGYYQHPELYHQPPENSTFWKGNSELMRQFEEPQQDSCGTELHQTMEQVNHLREKIQRHKDQQ